MSSPRVIGKKKSNHDIISASCWLEAAFSSNWKEVSDILNSHASLLFSFAIPNYTIIARSLSCFICLAQSNAIWLLYPLPGCCNYNCTTPFPRIHFCIPDCSIPRDFFLRIPFGWWTHSCVLCILLEMFIFFSFTSYFCRIRVPCLLYRKANIFLSVSVLLFGSRL